MDLAYRQAPLVSIVLDGQTWCVSQLLEQASDLPVRIFGLQVALFQRDAVAQVLARARARPRPRNGGRWSGWQFKAHPDLLAIAEMLLAAGANVNAGVSARVVVGTDAGADAGSGTEHHLSSLDGAIGLADNMALETWD